MNLSSNQCITRLKKFIKGTEWEGDKIEWGVDTETDINYIWNATNPSTKQSVKIVCNKITGKVSIKEV